MMITANPFCLYASRLQCLLLRTGSQNLTAPNWENEISLQNYRKSTNSKGENSFFLTFIFLLFRVRHMEVPRLGVQSKPHCQPTSQPQQCRIWATSVTYTFAHGNGGSLTNWVRSGIKPSTSRFLVRFVSSVPQWELQ